jgi:hypothetical protein
MIGWARGFVPDSRAVSESDLRPVGGLVPGCRVTGAVASHQSWCMIINLGDYERVGASIDRIRRRHDSDVQDLAVTCRP